MPDRETSEAGVVLSLEDIAAEVEMKLKAVEEGPGLSDLTRAFVELGVAMSVPVLDVSAGRRAMEKVLRAGGTPVQIQEIIVLVSALGVHSLFDGMRMAADLAVREGELDLDAPLSSEQVKLRNRYVGDLSYWKRFDAAVPGFLDGMLRMSPATYQGFFDYCALPFSDPTVPSQDKELVSIASDATPSHRYLPTLSLHVDNALKLGVGGRAIRETLALAATAPPHTGVR